MMLPILIQIDTPTDKLAPAALLPCVKMILLKNGHVKTTVQIDLHSS